MEAGKRLKMLVVASICAVSAFSCAPNSKSEFEAGQLDDAMNGIIGGSSVSASSAISRSTVAIYDVDQGALCTGSLIAKDVVVSAAHCVGNNPSSMVVVFDVNADKILSSSQDLKVLLKNPKVRQVQKTLVSGAWAQHQNDAIDTGDISVIKFAGSAPAGFLPISRLKDASVLKNGALVTLAGYGISNGVTGDGAGFLRQVQVKISNAAFGKTEVELDQTHGKGACHGDSGGPALISVKGKAFLFGVTSRGERDDNNDCSQFSVYTNTVAYNALIDKALATLSTAK